MAQRQEFPYFYVSKCALYIQQNKRLQVISILLTVLKLIEICDNLYSDLSNGGKLFEIVLDTTMNLYMLSMAVNAVIYRDETIELISSLKQNLFDYAFHEESSEDEEHEIERMYKITRLAECIILTSFTKAYVNYVIWPILENKSFNEIVSGPHERYLNSSLEFVVSVGVIGLNISVGFLGSCFHIGYQVLLVNIVTCLRWEIKVCSSYLQNIDLRARRLAVQMKMEAEMFHRDELPCLSEVRQLSRSEEDQVLWEFCLSKCLTENIQHHQRIIWSVKKMNQVLQTCLFTYAHIIGVALATSIFLIAREDKFSFNSFIILFIALPSLLSMRLICFFGQSLENESDSLSEALYACPWVGKPQGFTKSLRIMMLMASKTLHLRAFMFSLNNKKLLELLNMTYTLLNFLITMNNNKD